MGSFATRSDRLNKAALPPRLQQPGVTNGITSTRSGEGKSTCVVKLAEALAGPDTSILVIDADMRRPALHKRFGATLRYGLSNVIEDGLALDDVMQPTRRPGVRVVTAGRLVEQPEAALASDRFAKLLTEAKRSSDAVLIDLPPLEIVPDVAAVAPAIDTFLLLVRVQSASARAARRAAESLRYSNAHLTGCVLNLAGCGSRFRD